MRPDDLVAALTPAIPAELAREFVADFLQMRHDVTTGTLGRAAPGKFVETLVQILEYLETGSYPGTPSVDQYLRALESRASSLHDGLRICGARMARAMYALRSKRSIAHKGEVDPNDVDLRFLFSGAQWLMTELLRTVSSLSMDDAARLIARVQAPVGSLVEDFGHRLLAVPGLTARDEILLLLSHTYPLAQQADEVARSADRVSRKTVTNTLRKLWQDRLVEGSPGTGYRLTGAGLTEARSVAMRVADASRGSA